MSRAAITALLCPMAVGCVSEAPITGAPCPCVEGFACCEGICIPNASKCNAPGPDAGVPNDAGISGLMLEVAVHGPGSVRSQPSGIDCGSSCARRFPEGAEIELVAEPSPAGVFAEWGGACRGAGTCTITMNRAHRVFATFTEGPCLSGALSFGGAPGLIADWSRELPERAYSDLTVEIWMRAPNGVATCTSHYAVASYDSPGLGPVWIGACNDALWNVYLPTDEIAVPTEWAHVAVVWDSAADELRLFLDGEAVQVRDYPAMATIGRAGLWIGSSSTDPFPGELAGLRVSKVPRYASPFVPPTTYVADEDTLLLVPMTESFAGEAWDIGPFAVAVSTGSSVVPVERGPYCAPHQTGCTDGSEEIGDEDWGRSDVVYCESGRIEVPAVAEDRCGAGWHVCSGEEFTTRNDTVSHPFPFAATVDDGPNCVVLTPNLRSDRVWPGGGSCAGDTSSSSWSRRAAEGLDCGAFAGRCGVLCCR